MPHKSFRIPVRDPLGAEDELNAFIRSHRILEMDRKWVEQGTNSFWAIWVEYLDSLPESVATAKRRVDYREVLSPEDFAVFSQLREFRKEVAEKDGTALYNVFNNEQLACIVQKRVRTLQQLEEIPGIGKSRVEKYGPRLLEFVNRFWKDADEEGGKSPRTDN